MPKLFLQDLPRLHGLVCHIAQRTAYAQGIVIAQKAFYFTHDHGHTVGGKPHLKIRVEIVDGFDQPNAAHLKQIVHALPPPGKALHNT